MATTASATIEMEPLTIPSADYRPLRKSNSQPPLSILLVEDDLSDAMLTEMSLDATNVDYELHLLDGGKDVMDYLSRQGQFCGEQKPDIVFLDLSLPGKDGFEILAEMAVQSERFGDIPVVILTGDLHSAFLTHSYELNVIAYITKPCSVAKLKKAFNACKAKL